MKLRENRLERGIRLFDNPLLDWGSRVHPLTPLIIWGSLAVAAMLLGWRLGVRGPRVFAYVALGYLAWLLAEYAIHRWFFHFQPRAHWLKRWFYYVHEHHHRYQERDRLLAPPLLSLSIGAALVGVAYLTFRQLIGTGETAWMVGGGALAYLVYDYTHLFIHFAKPRTRWGRFLRRCHYEHHFARPGCWFCISFPPLDYLFGTQGGRRAEMDDAVSEPFDVESLPVKVRQHEADLKSSGSSR